MSKKLFKIHLSQVRTFRFHNEYSKLLGDFKFITKNNEYFENVLRDIRHLGKKDYNVSETGKIRSVLDYEIQADPFFDRLHKFYAHLYRKKMNLCPHYPCAIDILPSEDENYHLISSTLPGSLADSDPKKTKISLSMRIYPVGVASLRLGCFLSTEKSFEIEDIIDFLWNKETNIQIGKETFNVDALSVKFAKDLLSGLIEENAPSFRWLEPTYNIIDIVEASGLLPLEQSCIDVFLPLLTLQEEVKQGETGANLSRKGDVLLIGEKSAVFYSSSPRTRIMDRRKVRRWLRNSVELLAAQQYLTNEVKPAEIAGIFDVLKEKFWNVFKKGLLPPEISPLFSLWIYMQLHKHPSTMGNENWRNRYLELLKVLDRNGTIDKTEESAWKEIMRIRSETTAAEKKLGRFLNQVIEFVKKSFIELKSG